MDDERGGLVEALYLAPPAGFVAARDAAVASAREAGDRPGAVALAALRRPTVGAWLVNLLAIRRPELIADLVELAGRLREAQHQLRGEKLRELSARRRAAIGALVEQARMLAVEADPKLARASLPLQEVEATLSAAIADEEVAAAVRTGRLLRTTSYAGFGEPPPVAPQVKLTAPARGDRSGARKRDTEERKAARAAEAEARAEHDVAAAAEREAAAELADKQAILDRLTRATAATDKQLAELEAELARLTEQRAAALAARGEASDERRAAEEARDEARREFDARTEQTHAAQARLFAARRRLAATEGG